MATATKALAVVEPDQQLWSAQEIAHFHNYVGEVELTVQLLRSMVVIDRDTAQRVADGVAECKKIAAHIDMIRRGQVDPLNEQVKSYNDTWRPLTDALKQFEAEGKRKLQAFQQAEREQKAREALAAQRAQEEAARKEREALAKAESAKTEKARQKALADAQAAGQALMQARIDEPVQTDGAFRSAHGSTTTRMVWKFQIRNPADVPRQYLVVDEKAIRAAVAAGVRQIPGVDIYEEETLATRF